MVIITSPPLSVANMGYFFKLKATALVIFCIYNYAFLSSCSVLITHCVKQFSVFCAHSDIYIYIDFNHHYY